MKQKSLFWNTVKYGFSSVSSLLMFILLVIAGRQLGAEEFGIFSFALALTMLFEPVLDMWFNQYIQIPHIQIEFLDMNFEAILTKQVSSRQQRGQRQCFITEGIDVEAAGHQTHPAVEADICGYF